MSFDAEWLDLREPADHAARDPGLLKAFAQALPPTARIIDLGSGTGSTVRAVSSLLPAAKWLLTDSDPALLAEAKRRAPDVDVECLDLSVDLSKVLTREADAITASALIDLVSAEWLDSLIDQAAGRPLYIALSYDGQHQWADEHADDAEILTAFRAHQRSDKGFGPALGPEAVAYLGAGLMQAGYSVRTAESPWRLSGGPLLSELASGIATAAGEAGVSPEVVNRWLSERRKASECEIGHLDLLATRIR